MARAAQYAAAIVGLGILIGGIVLWRQLGKIRFVETREWDQNR